MTKSEAIEQLSFARDLIINNGEDWLDERDIPMLDMAIESLSNDWLKDITDVIIEYADELEEAGSIPHAQVGMVDKK